jgi:hypothetical protein
VELLVRGSHPQTHKLKLRLIREGVLLCPNCHAQTDTYCGKNIGRANACIDGESQTPTLPFELP